MPGKNPSPSTPLAPAGAVGATQSALSVIGVQLAAGAFRLIRAMPYGEAGPPRRKPVKFMIYSLPQFWILDPFDYAQGLRKQE